MPSILVTGNKGFIGSGLEGDGIDIKSGVDIVTYKARQKYDIVIHTAARTSVTESVKFPGEYERTNVIGTLNMLRQHPKAHFIYLSTASVYGEGLRHTVKSPTKPKSPYAETKLAGEYLVEKLAKSWCILRLTNVIGDHDRGEANVYQVFRKADVLPIYGDGKQTRDFIHVDKVRQVIRESYERQGLYNVGSGQVKTILDVAREFGKPLKFYDARPGEIRDFGIDRNALHNITLS